MKSPLNKLLIANRGRGLFRCDASGTEATIYLYDVITDDDFFGGVSASAFVQALAGISAQTIHLRINSPGGDVFAGQAIAQAIREKTATIVAHVDGLAASAASWVALACDQVLMAEGGFFMIHRANTIAMGDAEEMHATGALLEKVDAVLCSSIARQTGNTEEQVATWMAAETWFNAEEAVANGFAEAISGPAPKNLVAWNLAAWSNAPAAAKSDASPPPDPTPAPDLEPPVANTDHLRRRLRLIEQAHA